MTMITSVIDSMTACGISGLMTFISIEDCKTYKIRNNKVFWIALLGVIYRLVYQVEWLVGREHSGITSMLKPTIEGVLGMVVVALPMLILTTKFNVPIGGGDIKLTGALGIYVGWQGSLIILLVSCVAAIITYGVKAIKSPGAVGLKTSIPMGLYTHIGFVFVICLKLLELLF